MEQRRRSGTDTRLPGDGGGADGRNPNKHPTASSFCSIRPVIHFA
jgi:hypothetical protein